MSIRSSRSGAPRERLETIYCLCYHKKWKRERQHKKFISISSWWLRSR